MSDVKDNCPFCGSSKTSVEGFAGATAIECYDCGARGPMSENPSRAALGWWRRAQPEEDASALHMAKSLAIAIWEKHWRETSPHWQPMETLTGLISQIDNMTCTLVQRRAQPEANADAKDAERLDFMIQHQAYIAWTRDGEKCRVFCVDPEGDFVPMEGWDKPHHFDPRSAIDAVRQATPTTDAPQAMGSEVSDGA